MLKTLGRSDGGCRTVSSQLHGRHGPGSSVGRHHRRDHEHRHVGLRDERQKRGLLGLPDRHHLSRILVRSINRRHEDRILSGSFIIGNTYITKSHLFSLFEISRNSRMIAQLVIKFLNVEKTTSIICEPLGSLTLGTPNNRHCR